MLNALYLLYLHEKQDRKRLHALHHLISLRYSHWFFVSLFIQNNSTNNSSFLGQQLTELTSIIKGDRAERKMETHFLRDWFFFFFFFKPKHTGMSRRVFTIERFNLKVTAKNWALRRLTRLLEILKRIFFNHLNFFLMACESLITLLYKAHLKS